MPILTILFLTAITPHSALAGDKHPHDYSLENPKYHSMIVATVGPRQITAREFLLNYAFGPAFPKREKNSKEEYLQYMIYEKLLALDGYKRHLDTTNDAKISQAEMEGDLATEELYKQDVLARVKLGEAEIRKGIALEHVTCTVQWLYAKSGDEISLRYKELTSGIPFDSLFRLQFRNTSIKPDDRSMEMTRFRIGLRNPQLAGVLDTLSPSHPSPPIRTPDGYYIVILSNIERTTTLSQAENDKLHEVVSLALMQHLSDSLSDRYVQHLMADHKPTIVRRTLDILHVHFAGVMLPREQFDSWNLTRRLIDRWGPVEAVNVDPSLPLVEGKGVKYTAGDFLNWYRARDPNIKFSLTTPEAMFASLEGYVWQMVRDKLLTTRAYRRGLQHLPRVQEQLAWWKDKIIYNIVKNRFENSLVPNDDTLREYYMQHQRDFKDTSGSLVPFEKAKDDVLRAWSAFEKLKLTVHRVLALKEKYRITVNQKVLNQLFVDTENDPRAIDVYVGKPGGIFPRPAFPTIDYDWQAWN